MNDSLASTLVLCDLDNLLLGEDGNLTQVVRDVLQLFSSRGGRLTVFSQLVENYHCTENTGNQCGDCRAGNTKMKYPDQNGISTNIHNIGDHGNHHRPPGVLLGTENRCRGIIRRNKRE